MATLFEEYRLIERNESEINGTWKGAHLLLFFLAFVFGSFCTFCFHMLMYMFDEKCVLFPKLLSLTAMRHNVIYEFIPSLPEDTVISNLPVDFVSTRWVDKSTCALPTYVPLISGICGLVWTTMFFMCSTGSRTHTGLQRPWRVLPPVFIFSLAMGILCCYTSAITHSGLQELCYKLGELTGSSSCTYTMNVATLAYQRRIRGVYQATRLTILTAWLHTLCWLLSAALTLARVLLAVDFQLVRVNVRLHGDIERMLERQEVHLRTVSPEGHSNDPPKPPPEGVTRDCINLLYFSSCSHTTSQLALVPDEQRKLAKNEALRNVPKDKRFIVKMLYNFIDKIDLPDNDLSLNEMNEIFTDSSLGVLLKSKQSSVAAPVRRKDEQIVSYDLHKAGEILEQDLNDLLMEIFNRELDKISTKIGSPHTDRGRLAGTLQHDSSTALTRTQPESVMNITPEMQQILISNRSTRKSNLKNIGVQTEKNEGNKPRVKLVADKGLTMKESEYTETEANNDVDKETQTEKEKQE